MKKREESAEQRSSVSPKSTCDIASGTVLRLREVWSKAELSTIPIPYTPLSKRPFELVGATRPRGRRYSVPQRPAHDRVSVQTYAAGGKRRPRSF